MMQQPEVSAPGAAAVGSLKIALSDDARASLQAVRVAQETARARARQQTRQARLLFAIGAAAAVLMVGGLAPRLAHWRQARRQAPLAALPPAVASAPAPAATAAAGHAPVAPASGPSSREAGSAEPAPAAKLPAVVEEKVETAGRSEQACDIASVRSAAWRVSPEACARAFDADPTNPALALAVAQAEHARGHLTEAAQWAKRALALDPKAAEAYVLVARADLEAGRREDAGAAYRHYLALAPRGWHHAEARRALRPTR